MAETDGSINIKTKIDSSGVQKDLKGLSSKLSSATKATTALGGALTGVTIGLKASTKVIKETSNALNVQIKAEKQLEIAAKNNPYLNSKSVNSLKNYASELQKIGVVGDEQLMPFMAQLAASGRTEIEIQDILAAALDVSASGMISLDAAVQSLNASYSGNVGTLGRQISELKNLTAEELKNGKAVDIVKEKFKGMAEETAKATGSYEQMKNAQGDFNEAVGKLTKPTSDLWNNFWRGWYEKGIENVNKLNTFLENIGLKLGVSKTVNELLKTLDYDDKSALNMQLKNMSRNMSTGELETIGQYLNSLTSLSEKELLFQQNINKELQRRAEITKEQEEAEKKRLAAEEAAAKARKRNEEAQAYIDANQAALDKEIERITKEAELRGEIVDKQDILNAYISSYIDLVTGSDLVTENNPFSKKRLQELKDYAEGVYNLDERFKELTEDAAKFLGENSDKSLSDSIQASIDALTLEAEALDENSQKYKDYVSKIKQLEELKTRVIEKENEIAAQETRESVAKMLNDIKGFMSEFADIANSITDTMTKRNEKETNAALDALSKQYTSGLISYEEYCEKRAAINKDSAKEQYKIELWAWNAALLQAGANIAAGVASCLAETGIPTILKFVNMGLVAAAGAAQVASLMQSRPKPPAFQTGGIVGGTSYSGDNVLARVNSREMILNQRQQAQLFAMANGSGGGGGINLNVDVENKIADTASVKTQMTARGLKLVIDKQVNASMAGGTYNNALGAANANANGVTYL